MELCLAWGLWDELGAIAGDLAISPETAALVPPALLSRTAEAFTGRGLHAGAVGLLVAGRRWGEALDMSISQGVTLTESLAEALTPPKPRVPPGYAGGGEDGGGGRRPPWRETPCTPLPVAPAPITSCAWLGP